MPGDAPVSFILPRLSNLLYAFLLIPLSICGWLLWNALIWFPYTAATAKLPGPKRPSWVKGHAEAMFADPRGSGWCYKEWMEQFGGVYRIALLLGMEAVVISDPAALNKILVSDAYAFRRPAHINEGLGRLLGHGILLSEGDAHKKQRRLLAPAMNSTRVNAMLPLFYDKAEQLCRHLSSQVANGQGSAQEDLLAWTNKCASDSIGSAGLNVNFNLLDGFDHPFASVVSNLFGDSLQSMWSVTMFIVSSILPWLSYLPLADFRRVRRIATTIRSESLKMLHSARLAAVDEEREPGKDVLSLLVKANMAEDNEKLRLSEEEVLGQLSNVLLAGSETTGTALSWALYDLARNPGVQEALRAELRQAQASLTPEACGRLRVDHLSRLPYLDAVTKEVLRLRCSVPIVLKQPIEDTILPLSTPLALKDGSIVEALHLPRDTPIMVPIAAINTDKRIWGANAESFLPARWLSPLPGTVAPATQGYTMYSNLLTFLSGPRGCIGMRFGISEIKAVLAVLVSSLRFEECDGKPEIIERAFVVTKPYLRSEPNQSQLPLKMSIAE